MTVVEQLPKPVSRFAQIALGDVFCPVERPGVYYMKINGSWPTGSTVSTPPNAVCLGYSEEDEEEEGTGKVFHFSGAARVIWYPNARLTLGLARTAAMRRSRRRMRDDEEDDLPRKRRPTDEEPEVEVNDEEER